jgi:hypothetical protein
MRAFGFRQSDRWRRVGEREPQHNGDDMSDLAEYLAGTLPNNPDSLLRMDCVVTSNFVETAVSWASVPGRAYRVQFMNTLDDPGWNDLPGDVNATNSVAFNLKT